MYHLNCNYIITIEYKINEIEFLQKVLREGTFLNLAIWFQFSLHFMISFMRAIIPIMRFQRKRNYGELIKFFFQYCRVCQISLGLSSNSV